MRHMINESAHLAIEVEGLSKVYANGTMALDRISFKAEKKVTCILGRNGAGKTTLVRILSTQLAPSSGTASIGKLDVVRDVKKVRGLIASIPQEISEWGYATPMEYAVMYLTATGLSIQDAKRRALGIFKELDILRFKDVEMIGLSGGTKRKVFVAGAFASDAKVIFLDEPTTGLDPISRLQLWSVIKKSKSKIILTTHYMEEAKALADEIMLVNEGKVVANGTAESLLRDFKGKVRVEGNRGTYRIGDTHISYMKAKDAERLIEKGFVVKQVDLEDVLIVGSGVGIED